MKTFKKIVCTILVVLMLVTSAPMQGFVGLDIGLPEFKAEAASVSGGYLTSGYCGDTSDGDNGRNIYWEIDDEGVLTLSGVGVMETTPNMGDNRVTKVIIGEGITSLPPKVFKNCKNITEIVMPSTLVSIPEYAFENDSKIISIDFGGVQFIEKYAFYNAATSIAEMVFPETLKEIGEYAFAGYKYGVELFFPSSLEKICDYAFYKMERCANIVFSEGLEYIGGYAFYGASWYGGLNDDLSLPSTIKQIGASAFSGCYAPNETLIVPDSCKYIGGSAFDGLGIKSLVIGKSLITYSASSFSKLKTIELSDENTNFEVYEGVLYDNNFSKIIQYTSNEDLYLPDSFSLQSTTRDGNFLNGTLVKRVHASENSVNYKSVDGLLYSKDGTVLLTVPEFFDGDVVIQEGTEEIAEYAGYSCNMIKSIQFPSTLKVINNCAFSDSASSNLTRLIFPGSVEIIGDYAFNNNWYLKEIVFNEGLKKIGVESFCSFTNIGISDGLTHIEFPDTLEEIGRGAFSYCNNLTGEIIFPENCVKVGSGAFSNTKVTSFYLGKNLTSFGSSVDISGLKKIEVSPENENYASFDGVLYNKNMTSIIIMPEKDEVTLPDSFPLDSSNFLLDWDFIQKVHVSENNENYTSIDGILYSKDKSELLICPVEYASVVNIAYGTKRIAPYAFYDCYYISDVYIPDTVTSIGKYAFSGNDIGTMPYLKAIEIPSSVEVIEEKAFYNHMDLKTVIFNEGLKKIESNAFAGFPNSFYKSGLKNITLPNSLEYIGNGAFSYISNLGKVTIPEKITQIVNVFSNSGISELVLSGNLQKASLSNLYNVEKIIVNNPYTVIFGIDTVNIKDGGTAYAYCGSYGHDLAVKRLLNFESIGHTYLDWYVAQPATFEADGIERRDCAYCDGYDERIIPKLESDVFTATFVAGGEVIATVDFPKGTTEIAEPKVPAKDRYIGEWEEYTLADADITINAVYTLIKSEDASEIETESEVIHYTDKDDVLFRLKAWADALVVKSTVSKSVPLDIVLVVDQSGSMEDTLGGRTKKVDALKDTAKDFVNTVLENAKITGADHRISLVGFGLSGRYQGFEKNENTELLTSAKGIVKFDDIKTTDYATSLLSVNVDGAVNDALITAIDSIQARGATAADLGFEMAKGVFSNTNSDGRQRVVVFMTDGEPTYNSGFQTSVANAAIYNASLLKSAYDASIYSVGVFSAVDSNNKNINKFMNAVSSGYPDALSMSYLGKGVDGQYYLTVSNTDSLSDVFKTISTESLSHTAPFDNLTFVKTLSEYVTITSKQEEQLRIDLIRQYGITNDDIIITRNDDGTTTIQINGLTPYETTKDGEVIYEVSVEFFASLNEKAATAGEYIVDIEDSGVMLGEDAKGYEVTFDTSSINLTSKKTRVIFTVNGVVYEISENISGGYAVIPEIEVSDDWVFSGWDTKSQKATNGLVLDATLTKADRTITWHTDDGDIIQKYAKGDIITAPEVPMTAEGDTFLSWDKSIPTTMPDENLEFTAVYGKHVHKYASEVTKKMTCTADGVRTFTCSCGNTYDEVINAIGHNYEALTPSLEKEDAKCTFCCTNCGDKYDYALDYEVVESTGKKYRVLYEFSLTDDELNTDIQPDGSIQIRIPLSELHGSAEHVTVIRTNDDGSKTQVPAVHEKGFLIITCDHFTPYEIIFDIPCEEHKRGEWVVEKAATCTEEGLKFALCTECEKRVFEEAITKLPHTESGWITDKEATCKEKGSKHTECKVCNTTIKTESIKKIAHNYNGDSKCDACGDACDHMCHKGGFNGFIWKIVRFFWKLFKMNPTCDCGSKHY